MLAKEKMAALSDEAREEVRAIAQKVVAKLLAGPRESLKRAARNGQWAEYANVVSDLFRFNDRPGADRDNSEAKNDKDSRKRQ
jgi:glutamyl-tRNA reductase